MLIVTALASHVCLLGAVSQEMLSVGNADWSGYSSFVSAFALGNFSTPTLL